MKALNATSIAKAYFRFVGHFLVLIASIVAVMFTFLTTLKQQVQQLGKERANYTAALTMQRDIAQTVDFIYTDLSLLNKKLVRSDRQVEQRILSRRDELNAQLDTLARLKVFARRPKEVYGRISGCVNEMLVLKDSIATMKEKEQQFRRDLEECKQHEKKK